MDLMKMVDKIVCIADRMFSNPVLLSGCFLLWPQQLPLVTAMSNDALQSYQQKKYIEEKQEYGGA